MEVINFVGENLWIGNLGNILVYLATFAALFGAIFYLLNTKNPNETYLGTARKLMVVHNISVVGIFVVLFFIIFNHYYEYQYAWQHSSNSLPVYYMISCFWEGQEGSFLLWMFWHSVILVILRFRARDWESSTLFIIGLAQFALGSMLLGIEIGSVKIGSSPFVLLRDFQPDILNIPILNEVGKENYLQVIKDGSGLNPLLQNYWMVIHPPTLFFGFATAIVPFAYALAGLIRRINEGWLLPALIWTLISTMVLGAGIIMGGYWAYESLNFGGYWAWDPVENASLMPWILLISAAHILLISYYRKKLFVLSRSLLFFSFFLVLYATFLTRSGILGEASVHAFTDLGMSGQLLLLLFLFVFVTVFFTFTKRKGRFYFTLSFLLMIGLNVFSSHIALKLIDVMYFLVMMYYMVANLLVINPNPKKDDKLTAREFWMFSGSLVLLLSAIHVVFGTSSPVLNKLFLVDFFDLKLSVPGPDEFNKIQIYFAMGIALLSGMGQLFRYKQTPKAKIFKDLTYAFAGAIILTVLAVVGFQIYGATYVIFTFFICYTLFANGYHLIKTFKSLITAGASIAHLGFGILLLGVLVSSVKQKVLSYNNIGKNFIEETDQAQKDFNKKNILLVKGKPTNIDGFQVTFQDTFSVPPDKFFIVNYKKVDSTGKVLEEFNLKPNAQNNPNMGLVSNPDTKHYWNRDIFTHVTYESSLEKVEDFKDYKLDTVRRNQAFLTASGTKMLVLDSIVSFQKQNSEDFIVKAFVKAILLEDTFLLSPSFMLHSNGKNSSIEYTDDVSSPAGVLLRFVGIIPASNEFIFTCAERKPKMDYIVMTAIEFPFIRLVWAGTVLMVLGFFIALRNRIRQVRNLKEDEN